MSRAPLAACLALLCGTLSAAPTGPATPSGEEPVRLLVQQLTATGDVSPEVVVSGRLDAQFGPFNSAAVRHLTRPVWLRVSPPAAPADPAALPVILVRSGLDQRVELFGRRAAAAVPLGLTTVLPKFGGAEDKVFALPSGLDPGPLYARVQRSGRSVTNLDFSAWSLSRALAQAASHARIIAFAFGALMAMALSTLLVRFILTDQIYALYGTLFSLQAIYLAYFSGQGFHWPVLSLLRPFANYAYNVPVAVSAAAAALFVREFANLKSYSRRVYRVFGWLALAFVGLAVANVLRIFGLGRPLAELGNVMFLASAVFTLVVAFLAWRRGGNRAAGWFLIAWSLLCTFQIVIAVKLLYSRADSAEGLLYYGLAPSMVAAAVLVALGVSDHVRAQSAKLSEAERRAQTDPLTGVLNRRSLIEQLDSACVRALARDLPVSVLFLDLDHFKQINDTFGHAAGDACLAAIIPAIQAELRQSDTVGRYGGEEFVVILYGADAAAAHPIAERICRRIAAVRIEGYAAPIRLTCSIGVASSDQLGVWGQHLIAHADTAVYAAKRSGRNQVQLAPALAA